MSAEQSNKELQCYNRSCGKVFIASENTPESCLHHPGVPVFHDAYKKWSCCDRKTTDFTDFLNFKGCTRSYHSNIKIPEEPKPAATLGKSDKNEVFVSPQPLKQKQALKRPDSNLPMQRLPFTIGASLKPMLEKMEKDVLIETNTESDSVVALNTPCHNSGCRQFYKGEQSNEETCLYHSGVPIFHEGMKFWSCCVKRTTDFDSFLEQVGCTTGKHKWHKEKNKGNTTNCRYDWHQTGNSVVISVYSKCPVPDLSYIEANPVKLHMHIVFGNEKDVFDKQILLFGVTDIERCLVTYLGSKVEILLKKAELSSWKELNLREKIMDIKAINLEDEQ